MKKQIIYSLLALTTVCLGACNNNDEIDTANSIFSTEPLERNAFDYWLLDNYTYPYNIDFMYRMKDIESDHKYNLVPADYDKAVALSKIIKHVWMDAYVELAGMDFLRVYVPKTFHLIGSPAYESSGNMVLGTAEGGKKITLYNVNDLNIKTISKSSTSIILKRCIMNLPISCIRNGISTLLSTASRKENTWEPTGITT